MTDNGNDFNMVRIALASPEQINTWSYGEVVKPETINYRTLRPERDGLFCERIFGPTKDWECYCGKYKKIRYKGVICDRCGVEVARAKVRRERMGHIKLAAPVAHIWFSKGTPSRLGLLLDLSPRNLERVLYFAQYLIVNVDDELRLSHIERLQSELENLISDLAQDSNDLEGQSEGEVSTDAKDVSVEEVLSVEGQDESVIEQDSDQSTETAEDISKRKNEITAQIETLEGLSVGQLITESRYREVREHYADVFKARMGAEAVLEFLKNLDLVSMRLKLQKEIRSTSGQRRKKAIKTLRVFEAFRKSGNKPEWMIFSVLPVLPPELRPMVQLDGGRFATSDLNDLYRRVINRNNRLKRLLELRAPEIIIRNEKRMLQEAVDALIDNGRRGRAVSGSHNHKLKSLSDLLRGKQGRFRQNLLGKRVDYSGRSVITVGPTLKLYECGLPRRMAIELFKPFVMNRLVTRGYAHNIKSAKRLAERATPEVWDILEEIVSERPVLLNRAPTLHRLGIQAFKPVLVEGGTIKVHPLVCTAFNADFDGDQMAVHVPLSKEAVGEANSIMLSVNNMLSPSSGDPIVVPTLDMVLGCYYMTTIKENGLGSGRSFPSFEYAHLAYELGQIDLRALIKVRIDPNKNDISETSVGRLIFNDILPDEIGFRNQELDKTALKELTVECIHTIGSGRTVEVLDAIKSLGFKYASKAGITIAINDVQVSEKKNVLVAEAERKVDLLEQQYMEGLITEGERYSNVVQIWTEANDSLTKVIEDDLHNYGGIYLMAASGAKGNIAQIKQMAGMRGLMSDPKGRIIDRPIKSNFREGLSVLEYFISTHGARKGLADTALRTADSGYLTRRLIDVSQEITITIRDCETEEGIWTEKTPDMPWESSFSDAITSRYSAAIIADPETGEIIVERGEIIDGNVAQKITQANISKVLVRSPLTCKASRGVCSACYGISLATWRPAVTGEAVGIIAAQSIGEPGTQLTMRTFHTGGIAGADITSGLPRVEELFEARSPKGEAVLSEIDGVVDIAEMPEGRTITVISSDEYSDEYSLPKGYKFLVKDGDEVNIGAKIAGSKATTRKKKSGTEEDASDTIARVSGSVKLKKNKMSISWSDEERREYIVPAAAHIVVNNGDSVVAGQPMTAGPKSPQQVLRIEGRIAVQKYLIEEVQKVYRSQGVTINDRHIEIVVAQMLRKLRIDSPGDTDLLPGELVDRFSYEELNAGILAEGGEPSTATQVLLGITRASLNVESFLAAASFQETTRVLTESAINGDIDYLKGLKENVIIGRLIPARIDSTKEGRKLLGISDEEDDEQKVLPESVEDANPLEADGFKEPIAPI